MRTENQMMIVNFMLSYLHVSNHFLKLKQLRDWVHNIF